ncbi:leukotriene A-4 hydrolase-like [Temnothorax longispinosus]|uniref:leukotriene A-4 hydrolase-like n=1 Tax=Temnothorax longispinosus TaxID=300112 RepID=UPI003A9A41A3
MDQLPAGDDIPYSYSNPDHVAVTQTNLYLKVNFQNQVLEGLAMLTIEKKESKCNELVLDTYNLEITDVRKGDTSDFGPELTFTYEKNPHDDNFGRKLKITLPNVDSADPSPSTSKKAKRAKRAKVNDNNYTIWIEYKTRPDSPALYWLKEHQTSDLTHPLLISNTKLTYARAIFPCQDTPLNRIRLYSRIVIPSGCDVMMPGIKTRCDDNQDEYKFNYKKDIGMAPYEMYIIVGKLRNLVSTGYLKYNLWTTGGEYLMESIISAFNNDIMPPKIKNSIHFNNMIADKDNEVNVCVLPSNVPEFDMQCPHMTFLSSTSLQGRYSIIDTIVQNIIETWIEKIVPIKDFKDLWLIKGLSTFIYRNSINNEIHNNDIREILKIKAVNNVLNMQEEHSTDSLVHRDSTKLPMNIIKYVSEQGCVFLNYLQDLLGGPTDFWNFLEKSFFNYRDVSGSEYLTTNDFKDSLYAHFKEKRGVLDSVKWDEWFNQPGIPPSYRGSMAIQKTDCHHKADSLIVEKEDEESRSLILKVTHTADEIVIIEFLTYLLTLPTDLSPAKLRLIESIILEMRPYCEIKFLWLRLCIKNKWSDDGRITETALNFVCNEYCSPKYACPIFRDLYEWEETRQSAITRFRARADDNRSKMLPETINELSSILGVALEHRA